MPSTTLMSDKMSNEALFHHDLGERDYKPHKNMRLSWSNKGKTWMVRMHIYTTRACRIIIVPRQSKITYHCTGGPGTREFSVCVERIRRKADARFCLARHRQITKNKHNALPGGIQSRVWEYTKDHYYKLGREVPLTWGHMDHGHLNTLERMIDRYHKGELK